MYINKVILYGNLTRDPELKALPSGMSVCSFGLATNRVYTDRDGKRQEATEFHNVVVFGKQADTVSKYLTKGSGAFIEGSLRTQSWEKDGQKHYRTEVVVDRIQFGPRGGAATGGGVSGPATDKAPAVPEYPEEEINPEDIPF